MKKISLFVKSQLPEHIVDSYPLFVSFLEYYYEWLDELESNTYINDYRKNLDVDFSPDAFLDYFAKEFAVHLPTTSEYDKRKLLKEVSNVYSAKGTPKAYDLLFKMLYDSPVKIVEPKRFILKTSDGRWDKPVSIRVQLTSGVASDLIETQAVGTISGASAVVDDVSVLMIQQYTVTECFLERNSIIGNFVPEVVNFYRNNQIVGTGQLYVVPISVVIDSSQAGATSIVELVVEETVPISDKGYVIRSIYDDDMYFAGGYQTTANEEDGERFKLDNDMRTAKSRNSFTDAFRDQEAVGFRFPIEDITGEGAVAQIKSMDFFTRRIKKKKNVEHGAGYSLEPTTQTVQFPNGTNVTVTINKGVLCEYEGYWRESFGLLDDSCVIQDSHYYQEFSYVIKSNQVVKVWKDVVEKLLHPAGLKYFAEYHIDIFADVTIREAKSRIRRLVTILLEDLSVKFVANYYKMKINLYGFGLGPTYDTIDRFKSEFYPTEAGYKNTENRYTDADNRPSDTQLKDIGDLVMGNFAGPQFSYKYNEGIYSYYSYGSGAIDIKRTPITNHREYQYKYNIKKKQRTVLDSHIIR